MSFVGIEEIFDEVVERVVGSRPFTGGPMGGRGTGRTLSIIDPDGNETGVDPRYAHGKPSR